MTYDVLVLGGAGVDTTVRVPGLPLPYRCSYHVPRRAPGIVRDGRARTVVSTRGADGCLVPGAHACTVAGTHESPITEDLLLARTSG
ncbi:hypothetical protein SAMN05421874_103180 [Nonomuraea maritima]|uniref:Uncharacterized protein n=1 Tax=Nonomuraea maritima TaxID=683260 RepID=A0A1G8WI74_9ACTN|nr:hypothetical protein [Nonomuraea maritima]SDJ77783.1 hypothetical protein SAMN05421874_103180 [Nonomuraea maritima]